MREVYKRWMKEHSGAIVNVIADIWNGWPNYAHSGAARGGMWTLTEKRRLRMASDGVRVNAVAPGGVASSGFDTYEPDAQKEILKFPTRIPMQRYGNVAEVSAAITFLLSPAAAFITGSCIRVDGGAPNARPCWKELVAHDRSPTFGDSTATCRRACSSKDPKSSRAAGNTPPDPAGPKHLMVQKTRTGLTTLPVSAACRLR